MTNTAMSSRMFSLWITFLLLLSIFLCCSTGRQVIGNNLFIGPKLKVNVVATIKCSYCVRNGHTESVL